MKRHTRRRHNYKTKRRIRGGKVALNIGTPRATQKTLLVKSSGRDRMGGPLGGYMGLGMPERLAYLVIDKLRKKKR